MVLFECAICVAIASLVLVGLAGLIVVFRVEPFKRDHGD
jgi:hypothetical protein